MKRTPKTKEPKQRRFFHCRRSKYGPHPFPRRSRRSSFALAALFLFCLSFHSFSGAALPDDPFKALAKVPSYFDLTAAPGLTSYRVLVEGRGEVWQEIARTLGEERANLVEYFRAPNDVSLQLQGREKAAQFIPGLFDPNRAVRFLIDELESFRDQELMARLQEQGNVQNIHAAGRRIIEIVPRKSVLLERFLESGTQASLIRIYRIRSELDSASGRILRFEVEKETRNRSIGSPWKSDTLRHLFRFDFGYQISKSKQWLPRDLEILRDGKKEMRFTIEYGRTQGWDLPALKQVEYRMGDHWESASLVYGEYVVNLPLPDSLFEEPGIEGSRQELQKASRLSQMAEKALDQGKVEEARRRLEALIKQYPDTPQARQAMIFLGEFRESGPGSKANKRKKLP